MLLNLAEERKSAGSASSVWLTKVTGRTPAV
jgi:hypothetical protein